MEQWLSSTATTQKSIIGRRIFHLYWVSVICELNFIEFFWGEVKRYLQEHCDYSYQSLQANMPKALESVDHLEMGKFSSCKQRGKAFDLIFQIRIINYTILGNLALALNSAIFEICLTRSFHMCCQKLHFCQGDNKCGQNCGSYFLCSKLVVTKSLFGCERSTVRI